VHLVNYLPDSPVRHIPVLFSEKGFKPRKAMLYSPEHEPLELDLNAYGKGSSVVIPRLDTYCVLVAE
jgi:hypothetical protein